MNNYFIKPGYVTNSLHNGAPVPFIDTVEASKVFQVDVYRHAASLVRKHGLKSVADVGCGSGYKTETYLRPVCSQLVGIDAPDTIAECKKLWPNGEWISDDFEHPAWQTDRKMDLVMSADVIEHLNNPDLLIQYMLRLAHKDSWIIISTPDRDGLRGADSMGPSPNICHIREWNRGELASYVQTQGLRIVDQRLVRNMEMSPPRALWARLRGVDNWTCQMLTCRPA